MRILKKAPDKMRKAIVEEKVDLMDAKKLIEVGIAEEEEDKIIRKLSAQKKARERIEKRRATVVESKEVKENPKEVIDIKREDTLDREKMEKYKELWDNIRWWTPGSMMTIKNKRIRNRAIEYIRSIRDHCDELLGELE